jgi:hypothetical protein
VFATRPRADFKSEIQDTGFPTSSPARGLAEMADETLRSQKVQQEVNFTSLPAEIWLNCHVDSQRREQHILVMVSDITQRKQAEEGLKRLPTDS